MREIVVATAAGYSILYAVLKASDLFSRLKRPERVDALSRAISSLNVCVCFCSSFVLWGDIVTTAPDLERTAFGSTPQRDMFLHLVSGFMVYDLALLLYEFRVFKDLSMILHHLVVISGLQIGVTFQAGTFYMAILFMNEISTVFLNFRFMMLHCGMELTQLYQYNGIALAVSFFVARVLVITLLVVHATWSWWKLAFVERLFWYDPLLLATLSRFLIFFFHFHCAGLAPDLTGFFLVAFRCFLWCTGS